MTDITMPRLSDSMEEGTILRWLKGDGETVRAGEDLVEIETDKATVTHPAETAGTLQIVIAEGSSVPVGEVIARVGEGHAEEGEGVAAAADVPTPPPPSNGGEPAPEEPAVPDGPLVATPLAKRVARTHGVELERLSGSGPRGRITRADVLTAAGVTEKPAVPESEVFDIQEPTRIQQLIARRMSESRATIPDFEVETEA
ncbi:MAG TPA: biotin/lipoyl-containing protein, partial [Solirubrobacteraceae bacterium]|nr:biotin/lipoyl-containing protein [Solirubrobacteraceae bacterium]